MKHKAKKALAAVAAVLTATCAVADVAWPEDFWTQITNSMALPSGTQIGTSTASFAIAAPCRMSRSSNDTWLDSHKPGLAIMFK